MCATSIFEREFQCFPLRFLSLNIHLKFSTRRFAFSVSAASTFHRVRSARQHHHVAHLSKRDFYWLKNFLLPFTEKKKKKALTLCLCKNLSDLSAKLIKLWLKVIQIRSTQVQINGKNLTDTSKVYREAAHTYAPRIKSKSLFFFLLSINYYQCEKVTQSDNVTR